MPELSSFSFNAIGTVNSPYKEKFAIPRQPGLVSAARGTITLLNNANNQELVRGLAQFSHIWLLFVFHGTQEQGWKPLVRPPRLGGNKKVGVLATRSTFRPNPIGMSVVTLDDVTVEDKNVTLHISGLDLLNNTPILDIKPYIPYSDAITTAEAGFANEQPESLLNVSFSEPAAFFIAQQQQHPELSTFISQVLAQDPRPAYKKQQVDDKTYGILLYHFNIIWRLKSESEIEVVEITSVSDA